MAADIHHGRGDGMSFKGWDAMTIDDQERRIEELEAINAEMLAALEALIADMQIMGIVWSSVRDGQAAITKAEGEPV